MLKKLAIVFLLLSLMLIGTSGQVSSEDRTPVAWGIDVSSHQGRINWDLAQKDTNFAIIRCGYGQDFAGQDDTQWYNNVNACTRLKIPFGVYLYSYATTEAAARNEAYHTIRLLDGYKPSLPVYYDIEHPSILNSCTPEQILRHATIFCEIIRDAGYTPGVFSYANLWESHLTSSKYDQWEKWVAQYKNELHFSRPYSMWQHSETGTIRGIDGPVDLNYWYGKSLTGGCNHSYTSYTAPDATCTTSGKRVFTCSRCGYRYEERIPPYGHKLKETITYPTCEQGGYTDYQCHCGYGYRGNATSSTGHNMYMTVEITKEPTQTQTGTARHYCRKCGQTMWVEQLPSIQDHMKRCESAQYPDAPPYLHWAHSAIDDALYRGIFQGNKEGLFDPNGAMTRAMMVTVLWRLDGCPEPKTTAKFSDVWTDAWYGKAVSWAQENGIVMGVGEGRFNPTGIITREQLVTIIYRYVGYLGWWRPELDNVLWIFPDGNTVSEYARTPMNWAVNLGILTGTKRGDNIYLNPRGTANRMEGAKIIIQWAMG